MPKAKIVRNPCDFDAVYHAKELVKYTMVATKNPSVFSNQTSAYIATAIQQSALEIYILLSKAIRNYDTLERKHQRIIAALDLIASVQALVELLCDIDDSIVKNSRYWAEIIEVLMNRTIRWKKSISQYKKEMIPRDKNGFYALKRRKNTFMEG